VAVLIEGQDLRYGASVGLWIERQILFSHLKLGTWARAVELCEGLRVAAGAE
jgi:hypothetical protein